LQPQHCNNRKKFSKYDKYESNQPERKMNCWGRKTRTSKCEKIKRTTSRNQHVVWTKLYTRNLDSEFIKLIIEKLKTQGQSTDLTENSEIIIWGSLSLNNKRSIPKTTTTTTTKEAT
jgi:hypothetical protein